jgi:hypothetical protein
MRLYPASSATFPKLSLWRIDQTNNSMVERFQGN